MWLTRVRIERIATVVVLLVVLSAGGATVASAAGTTDLSVASESSSVTAGQTTTVNVILASASGGVGAAEFRVAVTDPTVASITDASVGGVSGSTDVEYADDGSWVDVAYFGADTANSGRIRLLTVTLEGETAGTTRVFIQSTADKNAVLVYDENGQGRYDVSALGDARLTVVGSGSANGGSSGGGGSGASGGGGDAGGSDVITDVSSGTAPEQSTPPADETVTGGGSPDGTSTPAKTTIRESDTTAPSADADVTATSTTSTRMPGFTPVVALLALLAAGLLAAHRER